MSASPVIVEVHLEELGQHSWLAALVNSLTGSYGSAQFRFVARPPSMADEPGHHVAVGATFPVMRFSDLDDLTEPNAWLEVARERLAELDVQLTNSGWRRCPDVGDHWWSVRYTRPTIAPTTEPLPRAAWSDRG